MLRMTSIPWHASPMPIRAGIEEMQTPKEMVDLWSTLGFIVEKTPVAGDKDLYVGY